ncbi:hypothetical protein EYZ11_011044 [Aspergillus tanneri]|uniref:chitinase n=1 Tax=Aspergillus tanneri TaxID=1220188 RepID=A0A4S3J3W0_9EURO|nr:hypothetical protein EYZ11_011044 [Aspergillus tanneri]
MSLSKDTPPFPAPIANAVCGPQKAGSKPPTGSLDIAALNPYPLDACCNIWGQCGITKDFCIDTNTGTPGTAEPGTYGCISYCGLDIIKVDGTGAIKIAYYKGYCLSRKYLFQDASQIDTSQYTHIHFGFGMLTPSYNIEFWRRILLFSGWDFSTMPATYQIFPNSVTPKNRLIMATKIADLIKKHNLDGVDIDWEYPGAPDLPIFNPGSPEEGPNYLAFLVILKNLLPGKSVSIATLSPTWDTHNSNSQKGCEMGNCLRSQVNLTETKQLLAMITKAGVPGKKVIVDAKKGKCTNTTGYIANAEIEEILKDPGRVVKSFVDSSSHSDILVYDDTEWVGYISSATRKARSALYAAWGLGGASDWASDLQKYHDVPPLAKSWAMFIELTSSREDPKTDHTRNRLNADAAWRDVVRIWLDTDSKSSDIKFMESVSSTLHMGAQAHCGQLISDSCISQDCPKGADCPESGPAAQLTWNSLVEIHKLYKDYYNTLYQIAAVVNTALKDLENKFAPIPPEEENNLDLAAY